MLRKKQAVIKNSFSFFRLHSRRKDQVVPASQCREFQTEEQSENGIEKYPTARTQSIAKEQTFSSKFSNSTQVLRQSSLIDDTRIDEAPKCICGPFSSTFDGTNLRIIPGEEVNPRGYMHTLFLTNNCFNETEYFDFEHYIKILKRPNKFAERNLLCVFGDAFFAPSNYIDVLKVYLYSCGALDRLSFKSIMKLVRAFLRTVGYGISTLEFKLVLAFILSRQQGEHLALILDYPEALQIFETLLKHQGLDKELHSLVCIIYYNDKCVGCQADEHVNLRELPFYKKLDVDGKGSKEHLIEIEDDLFLTVSSRLQDLIRTEIFFNQLLRLSISFICDQEDSEPLTLSEKRRFGYRRPNPCFRAPGLI